MIFDALSEAAPYFSGAWWRDVLAFAATVTPATPVGEQQIRGEDLLVRVLDLTTGPAETAVLESHRRYTDVQIVIEGGEFIRVWPAAQLTVRDPYDAGRDVMFYEHPADAPVVIDLMPGTFAVFRPQDAHMPALMKGAPARLRKMVFKVSNELIHRER
ncbi:MAG: DUF386 domain-containing protein [Acidobacteria bacterium]|nr:MAG: DUF386 domain-containing protein [Acidobacteriota bacterium]